MCRVHRGQTEIRAAADWVAAGRDEQAYPRSHRAGQKDLARDEIQRLRLHGVQERRTLWSVQTHGGERSSQHVRTVGCSVRAGFPVASLCALNVRGETVTASV